MAGGKLENHLEIAMDALRWPPTDRFRPPRSPARGPGFCPFPSRRLPVGDLPDLPSRVNPGAFLKAFRAVC